MVNYNLKNEVFEKCNWEYFLISICNNYLTIHNELQSKDDKLHYKNYILMKSWNLHRAKQSLIVQRITVQFFLNSQGQQEALYFPWLPHSSLLGTKSQGFFPEQILIQ